MWKKLWLLLAVALSLSIENIEATEAGPLILVEGGKPVASIILSATPTRAAQLGAYELQHYVELMTGASLPIVNDACNAKGIKIYIGSGNGIEKLGIAPGKFKNQEYLIRFLDDAIMLTGKDKNDTGKVNYRITDPAAIMGLPGFWDEQGTLYAVYDFLERFCGVRWFNPTEYGTFYPHVKTLTAKGMDVQRTPAFSYRDTIGAIGDNPAKYDAYVSLWRTKESGEDFNTWDQAAYPELHKKYSQKNFYMAAHKNLAHLFLLRMRNGGMIARCNHTMGGYINRYWDKKSPLFVESHPEYFAALMKENVRPHQVCFTNPKLIKQVVQDACDYYDGKVTGSGLGIFWNPQLPNLFPVEPMDNNAFCKCQTCKALMKENNSIEVQNPVNIFSTGIDSDYYFHFINEVAEGLNKVRLGKQILTLAYMSHAQKPSFKVAPNVAIEFCFAANRTPFGLQYENELKQLKEWVSDGSLRPVYLWLYYTFPLEHSWHGNYHCFPGFFAHTIDKQMKLFAQYGIRGMFHCGYGQEVEAYVTFKLMDDPTLNVDDLLEDYFTHMYGKAAGPMKNIYLDIEKTYCDPKLRTEGKFAGVELNWHDLGTAERMKRYGDWLAEAEKLADTDADRKRIELFKKAVWNYMCYGRENYLNPSRVPVPKVPEIVVFGGKTIIDSFSKSPLDPMWGISEKQSPVQSSDFGGTMIFPSQGNISTATLLLPCYKSGSACSISFDLCQTAGTTYSHTFNVTLHDANKTYYVQMGPNPTQWGNADTAGIYVYEKNETTGAYTGRIGAKGVALSAEKDKWQTISLKFEPTIGLTFKQTMKDGNAASFLIENSMGITKIDKISLSTSSGISAGWHVDNFEVQYVSAR
ncbi:MAG: DUF4838 domain-containing protein [Lentisphaerota bacterium]